MARRVMTNFRHDDMRGTGSADIVDVDDSDKLEKPEKPKEAPAPEPQVEQPYSHPPAPEAPAETGTSETVSADDVPYGTTPVVLAWVNGDKARAQLAYDKEQTLIPPRKGLSSELLEIINR